MASTTMGWLRERGASPNMERAVGFTAGSGGVSSLSLWTIFLAGVSQFLTAPSFTPISVVICSGVRPCLRKRATH